MTPAKKSFSILIRSFFRILLFGNYFLAFCIVALSFETTLKNGFSIRDGCYYVIVFLLVVIYYTHAYINNRGTDSETNPRSRWYYRNGKLIVITQIIYTLIVVLLSISLFNQYFASLLHLSVIGWILLLVFPATAVLYYGIVFPASYKVRLRSVAWLKPFIIGFVCTGAIVLYPMIFDDISRNIPLTISSANIFYFLTNWLFTTVIAIMFDIKDFAADHNYHLKTFVVAKGLRHTIFWVLLPLSSISYISFIVFALLKHFSFFQILVNTIPFLLLLYISTSFRRRHGILYYLVVIDGLLLVKAVSGIIAMIL